MSYENCIQICLFKVSGSIVEIRTNLCSHSVIVGLPERRLFTAYSTYGSYSSKPKALNDKSKGSTTILTRETRLPPDKTCSDLRVQKVCIISIQLTITSHTKTLTSTCTGGGN